MKDLLNLRLTNSRFADFGYMFEFFKNKIFECCTIQNNNISIINKCLQVGGLRQMLMRGMSEYNLEELENYVKIDRFIQKEFEENATDTFRIKYRIPTFISIGAIHQLLGTRITYGQRAKYVYFEGCKFLDFGFEDYNTLRRCGDEFDHFKFMSLFYQCKILILNRCYVRYSQSGLWYRMDSIMVRNSAGGHLEPFYVLKNMEFI